MILTGKAKEDFLEHIYYNEDCVQVNEKIKEEIKEEASVWLSNQDERFRNALIIEWFDSVGIYISISADKDLNTNSIDFLSFVGDSMVVLAFSRQEATEQAIKKANEIYNSK